MALLPSLMFEARNGKLCSVSDTMDPKTPLSLMAPTEISADRWDD
jgi:hypothetical protein